MHRTEARDSAGSIGLVPRRQPRRCGRPVHDARGRTLVLPERAIARWRDDSGRRDERRSPPLRDAGSMKRPAAPDVEERWLVVLRADGVVDAVDGGAPATWLGRSFVEAPGIFDALQRAAAELVSSAPTSIVRRRTVLCTEGERQVEVELLLVEALPIRRALTSVHELVMRTLDLFVSQAKSNDIELSFDLAEGVPPAVFVDSEKIAWAISTLVANALRYAKKQVGVHVRCESASNDLVVEVRDDGAGIPEGRARWLFERSPVTGKTAGLALLMVNDVMAAHRGSVAVKSTPGYGAMFTMHIPRISPPS